jgi:hypothetical protein
MNAVATALACGAITPGEAGTIAGVYDTYVRTAGIAKEKVAQADDVEDGDYDLGDDEVIDDCDR